MSNRKKKETVSRKPNELNDKFNEQIKLLRLACMNYDCGHEFAAIHIAISLRVLLIDSPKSLLTHIGKRNTIEFWDTCSDIRLKNDICGFLQHLQEFAYLKNVPEYDYDNFKYSYIPFCHNPIYNESEIQKYSKLKKYNEWMEQPICHNKEINAFLCRKDIIQTVSNQDGGAHVDKEIDLLYNHFRFPESGLNSERKIKASQFRVINTMIQPILRQIGHEILSSFKTANLLDKNVTIVWKNLFQDYKALTDAYNTIINF